MAVDALASSHPLSSKEEDILKPEQISALFDSITYSKVQYNWVSHVTVTPYLNVLFSSCITRQDADLQ